jgi:hypothetical protein
LSPQARLTPLLIALNMAHAFDNFVKGTEKRYPDKPGARLFDFCTRNSGEGYNPISPSPWRLIEALAVIFHLPAPAFSTWADSHIWIISHLWLVLLRVFGVRRIR